MMHYLQEAITNLLSAKLRSFLAILGVLVGTGSVVALISSSQLATAHAISQFKKLGTNLVALYIHDNEGSSSQSTGKAQFTMADVPALKKASDQIVLVAPYTLGYQNMFFNEKNLNGQIIGATGAFGEIAKAHVSEGRFVSFLDTRSFFCVIGDQLADTIRKTGQNPLYNQIRVGDNMFTVIGILSHWPENLFISADINQSLIIPIDVSYFLSKNTQIENILIRLKAKPNITAAQTDIDNTLKALFPNKSVQFNSPKQLILLIAKQQQTFNLLLIAIGSISLVVGGIGVMNIMLVSVIERRKEIGIRMAIGARQQDILRMFLIESVALTLFGGLLGVVVGVASSYVLTIITGWQFYFYVAPIVLGFLVSVVVGVVSGFYPAWRASKLNPIETLTQ